ncbi:MAG: hypothetical protein ACRD3A_07380 [Terriglobales bacterium]
MNVTSVARGLRSVSIYRRLLCCVTVLSLLPGAAAQAEKPSKPHRSARAVALIEWKKGALEPRLLPISLLWEGKYYDAGLYQASPRPLALEPGTVYEAMRAGAPAGLFTVRGAREVNGVWYGDGIWSPGVTGSVASASGEDERPRLHRTAPASAPAPAPSSSSSANPEPEPTDPNRPTLHRGRPTSAPTAAPAPSPAAAAKAAPPPAKSGEKPDLLVAVSDAELQETRPYLFQWNRDEEERLTGEMKALAEAEVARQASDSKPVLDQVRVRAFDLNTDNLPEIVLTARSTVARAAPKGQKARSANYYVTVVARVTVSGELRKLFQSVAPSLALDSVPRMELVDAVDADGDGPAELLFALVTDSGRSYAIYRVGRDELWKLVESGSVPND